MTALEQLALVWGTKLAVDVRGEDATPEDVRGGFTIKSTGETYTAMEFAEACVDAKRKEDPAFADATDEYIAQTMLNYYHSHKEPEA